MSISNIILNSRKKNIISVIDGWCTRFLSQGGREMFIKSILQAILMYPMMCFLLPISFSHDLERIIAKFWWQKGHDR